MSSLGSTKIINSDLHTESLLSYGAITSFVVNNGCNTLSDDDSCSWISIYTSVSFDEASRPVLEPSTLAIFALGLIGLASRRFKR